MADVNVVEYVDDSGKSRFATWFEELNAPAAAKVTTALYRLGQGNFSNVKGVGRGVFEYRIDFGPGYRIYFGNDGETVVILLGGSTKKRQQQAIQTAWRTWIEYKVRKAARR